MCNEKFVVAITFVVMIIFTVSPVVGIAIGPMVTNPDANPDTFPADGTVTSELCVTVTDLESFVVSVTIDLSEIGGSTAQDMCLTEGNIYSTTTTAAVGTAAGPYNLIVNATNINGYSNVSVSVPLTVTALPTPTPFIPGGGGGKGRETPTPTATPTPTSLPTASPQVTLTPPTQPVTPTPSPTATPTPSPTATPPPKEPGFEAVFAIAGLLAVAYLVVRREKR